MVGRRPLGRMAMVTFALPAAAMFLWAVPAAAQGKWAMGTPMPTPRSEVVAAALGGLIYIVGGLTSAGGLTTFEAYDPATDTWQGLAPIPEARHHTATAALGGRIYVTGGYGRQGFSRTLDSTWVFDPAAGAWSRGPAMPGVRAAHAMAALDGRLFVAGGIALDPQSVWSYDPTAGVWETGWAPLETLREHTSATVLDGKLYLLGGRWRRGNLAVGAVFDPATNAWTPLPDMPSERGGLTAAAVGGRIHVTGGEELSGSLTFDAHEVYDPLTGTWQVLPPLPTARHGLASAAVGDTWYVIGGATLAGGGTYRSLSTLVEAYTP